MDEQRSRIQEDLRGLVTGEVRCDDVFLQLYASDASLYQIKPLGVIRPRSMADVAAALRYARDHSIPIHAHGAGTGLAGESLGPGLVLDFSKYFRRVLAMGSDWVRVQPGVVLERLNDELAVSGRHFGPDPAMSHVTTMGSVVAIDAVGRHWLKYGSAPRQRRATANRAGRRHGDGRRPRTARERRERRSRPHEARAGESTRGRLLVQNAELIKAPSTARAWSIVAATNWPAC